MGEDIARLAQQLGAAVELTMNPTVPMEQRHQVGYILIGHQFVRLLYLTYLQAFNQLEAFKENSPYGSQCGFYLVGNNTSPMVRHFGLKILEDVVKMVQRRVKDGTVVTSFNDCQKGPIVVQVRRVSKG